MPLRYISLFSGGFGLDLGFEEAGGYEVAACTDFAPAMRNTIRHNRPHVTVVGDETDEAGGDLYELPTDVLLDRAGLAIEEADLVIGGPPCQAFSILGNRQGFEDPRGSLMLEFVRVVREARPKCFVMENVAGFLNLHNGTAYQHILQMFDAAGYPKERILTWRLNAVWFGVPQFRERIFLVGFRDDVLFDGVLSEPIPTHAPPREGNAVTLLDLIDRAGTENDLPAYITVGDVFQDIANDSPLPNHVIRPHGERVRNRYAILAPGQRDRTDHTDRLRLDRPSGTVLVGSSDGGGRPFIHPVYPRHITVREAARLQSFPDTWIFRGSQTDQYRQVGNAVPPLLARAVAQQIKPALLAATPVPNRPTIVQTTHPRVLYPEAVQQA